MLCALAHDVAIIPLALLGVAEDGVGLGDGLETGVGGGVVGVEVRVGFAGEDVEALFEVGGGDGGGDVEDLVVGLGLGLVIVGGGSGGEGAREGDGKGRCKWSRETW